ncbi:MAG TPA: serine hydrolase domain-containing protein [Flavobacterium sp.]
MIQLIILVSLSTFLKSFSQDINQIEKVLDSTYQRDPFFANLLITKNGKVLFEKSYGFSDYLNKRTLTNQSSFQIASISKQFTAFGIMILKNKKMLDYDSLVFKYLLSFPYKNVTVRHLLTHSSGLPMFWEEIRPKLDTTRPNGNMDVLDYLNKNQLPLQFQPGTNYQYSDIGYDFLANIIEGLSGSNYQDFMKKNIFKPLKMKNSYAYMVTDIRQIENKNLAIGHIKNFDITYAHLAPKNNLVYYLGKFYGDGSVVTTARDLAIWDQALKECKLLPCNLQNESIVPFSENGQIFLTGKENKINYGFGWRINNDAQVGRTIYHSGLHPGNQASFYRLLDKNITLIYLSNYEKSEKKILIERLSTLLSQ